MKKIGLIGLALVLTMAAFAGQVKVTLTGADGKPLAGAKVTVTPEGGKATAEVLTGKDGAAVVKWAEAVVKGTINVNGTTVKRGEIPAEFSYRMPAGNKEKSQAKDASNTKAVEKTTAKPDAKTAAKSAPKTAPKPAQ